MNIVLIYPPFGAPGSPGIGIASLAGYLNSRGIPVSVLDTNNACYRALVAPEHLKKAGEFIESRMASLNAQPQLCFTDMVEYARMIRVAREASAWADEIDSLLDSGAQIEPNRRLKAVNAALNLASLPYFPQMVDIQGQLAKYFSHRCEYSSRDLLSGAREEDWLYDLLAAFLEPAFRGRPDGIIGISVCFPSQVLAAFKCARIAKRISPRVHVCMGGSFISCHMRNIKEPRMFDVIDSLVLDDGEIPLERLVGELAKPAPELGRVPGLVYRLGGGIRKNKTVSTPDMAALPPPDYRLFPLDDYLISRKSMSVPFRLSRGCAWRRCAFCRTHLPMVSDHQQPSADYLYHQLKTLVDQTGITDFHFSDDSASPEVLESLSRKIIAEKLGIQWSTSLRFDPRLTVQRCLRFKQAGCSCVVMGLEAYNDRLLRLMNKGITTKLVDRVLSNMSWAGLSAAVYMIVGFPTETEAEALASLRAVQNLKREGLIDSYLYSPYQITPYSAVAVNPEKFGITGMRIPAHLDLDPPITDFDCIGMSRERAHEVGVRSGAMVGIAPARKGGIASAGLPGRMMSHGGREAETLIWNGSRIGLDYSPSRIRTIMEDTVNKTLSFSEWLAQGDRSVRPIRRREASAGDFAENHRSRVPS
jgi:anaerobic magnesium-protoporphyrin IX monomethyl ester cyclase